ncbi:putative reverse transcriptase domain-containing protein [Tanacetum coccineum]
MIKKFGLEDSKPMKTPMSTETKLTKDEEGESVDNTKYKGMIGTDIAKISRKRSKPDNHEHENGIECSKAEECYQAAVVEQLIEARVSAALANHETLRNSTNGHGDGSHNSDTRIRGTVRTPRVIVLSQWFEKIKSVFDISNCAVENQVKFTTYTFLRNALTWWNSHMKTVTQDVAYAMDWKALKKMMTVKYCPRGEIKKLEIKLWNLKVKGTDVASYTLHFQELALMCRRMFHEESEEVKKYVGGLPGMIRENVMSTQDDGESN